MRVNLDPTTNTNGNQTLKTIAIALFALCVVMMLADDHTVEEAHIDANYYCEMVYLFITSSGENGYPDYRNQYDKICHLDKVKSVN